MANTIIGRVLATEKKPTTIDDFTFWTDPELILNPFDIVKVQHTLIIHFHMALSKILHTSPMPQAFLPILSQAILVM